MLHVGDVVHTELLHRTNTRRHVPLPQLFTTQHAAIITVCEGIRCFPPGRYQPVPRIQYKWVVFSRLSAALYKVRYQNCITNTCTKLSDIGAT